MNTPAPSAHVRRILLLCGSLRSGSTNHAMLDTAAQLLPLQVLALRFDAMHQLPHFNPDDDHDPLPDAVRALRSQIAACDALLISTPEYAGALPGSFKNLLDWTIGGGEIYGKPVAWINTAGPASPSGGADAHDSLRKVLHYAGTELVEEACVRIPVLARDIGPDGVLHDADIRARTAAAVETLVNHAAPAAAA